MKLTKDMKLVLNTVNSSEPNWMNNTYSVDFIFEKLDMETSVYEGILRTLHNEQYIRFTDNREILFVINETGRSFKEFSKLEIKEFLIKSITVPIIVSAITTLITIGITQLFS